MAHDEMLPVVQEELKKRVDDMLKIELEELQAEEFDLDLLGFNQGEINTLLGDTDDFFDSELELDEDDEKEPTKTDEGYAEFSIVLTVDNKQRLLTVLNRIKNEQALETNEDALMFMVGNHGA
jgi:hypothetical protein